MRYLLLAALLLFPAAAQASVVVGESCTQLGTSTMTTDQQSIATCLKNDEGKLIWKSMIGSDNKWVDVPLTDKNPFDITCEYRFLHTEPTNSFWWYAEYVSPSLVSFNTALGGGGSYVTAANKIAGSTGHINPVAKIEKRCP